MKIGEKRPRNRKQDEVTTTIESPLIDPRTVGKQAMDSLRAFAIQIVVLLYRVNWFIVCAFLFVFLWWSRLSLFFRSSAKPRVLSFLYEKRKGGVFFAFFMILISFLVATSPVLVEPRFSSHSESHFPLSKSCHVNRRTLEIWILLRQLPEADLWAGFRVPLNSEYVFQHRNSPYQDWENRYANPLSKRINTLTPNYLDLAFATEN